MGKGKRYNWTADEIKLLGTASDKAIADQLGLATATIAMARKRYGIPSFNHSSAKLDLPRDAVKLLGKCFDADIGRRFGFTAQTVRARRLELGIQRCKLRKRTNFSDYTPWGPTEIRGFDFYTDDEIAKMTGRSLDRVKAKRAELAKVKAMGRAE